MQGLPFLVHRSLLLTLPPYVCGDEQFPVKQLDFLVEQDMDLRKPKSKKQRLFTLTRIFFRVPGTCRLIALIALIDHFSSVAQSCLTFCNPTDCSMSGFPVHYQTQVHQVGDAIQPSYLLSPPSPSAFNYSQNQGLFQ